MKKLSVLFLGICALVCGCSSDDDVVVEKYFDTTRVEMQGCADTIALRSVKDGWTVDCVMVDGVNFMVSDDAEAKEMNFAWLTLKRTDNNLTFITAENRGSAVRNFTVNIKDAAGAAEAINGSQAVYVEDDSFYEEELDGQWGDNIHLSHSDMALPGDGCEFMLTTAEDSRWHFSGIYIYEDYEHLKMYQPQYEYNRGTDRDEIEYSYDLNFKKTLQWVSVRREGHKIFITLEPNKSGRQRYFNLCLGSGNYYGWFYGCQAAE